MTVGLIVVLIFAIAYLVLGVAPQEFLMILLGLAWFSAILYLAYLLLKLAWTFLVG